MNSKKYLSAILISTVLISCSFSKISLKLNYGHPPITLKLNQKKEGSYEKINFWPDKIPVFFDRNKNGKL